MTLASSKNLFLGIEREQWREMDLPPPPPRKNLFGNIMIRASLRDSLRLVKIESLYMENFITNDKYIVG